MKNQVKSVNAKQFHNEEFGELEILLINDRPYFPASDCAKILGYKNPRKAIIDHCRGVTKRDAPHPQNPYKQIELNYIPEGDLYRLIARSKLPAAERFERWVFDEVLPSIRKYGAYVLNDILEAAIQSQEYANNLLEELRDEKGKTEALLDKIDTLYPKALYCDLILESDGVVQTSLIADDYGMSTVAFNRLLHDLKIQYKVGSTWVLYRLYANKGYTKSRTYYLPNGQSKICNCWTQAGRMFLYETLCREGIFPVKAVE